MNKVRGYGFVSFADFAEGARALKEMDGKYVGSRPVKLSKSTWASREPDKKRDRDGGGILANVKKQRRNPKLKHLPTL